MGFKVMAIAFRPEAGGGKKKLGDCPDCCVSKNGTVPFAACYTSFVFFDKKILTGPKLESKIRKADRGKRK
jgi:hypothetical protein